VNVGGAALDGVGDHAAGEGDDLVADGTRLLGIALLVGLVEHELLGRDRLDARAAAGADGSMRRRT